MEHTICNQKGCTEPPAFRFTWPGRDEQAVCAKHEPKMRDVAGALGFHLQLIPLEPPVPEQPDVYGGSMRGPGGARRCGD